MHPTKELLINRNGMYCMLCGKECSYWELEWHHIRWKCISKRNKQPIDNSYGNGSLLCNACHHKVHALDYYSDEYKRLMSIVRSRKR